MPSKGDVWRATWVTAVAIIALAVGVAVQQIWLFTFIRRAIDAIYGPA